MIKNKPELKNGMFGRTTDGDSFVVIGNRLVYQKGTWDYASYTHSDYEIEVLYENLPCFAALEDALNGEYLFAVCVYDIRNNVVEMTVSEIEEKLGIKNLKIIAEDK